MSKLKNVERLMHELTIDQHQNVQKYLSKEPYEKQEELRKMVTRVDVLNASNTIKKLKVTVADIGENMKEIRNIAKTPFIADYAKLPVQKENVFKLSLLLNMERSLNTPTDSLGDVFTFLLTENLHRGVSIKTPSFKDANIDINHILQPLGDRLISHRLALRDRLEHDLGKQVDWEDVSGIFAALALLNQLNLEELLEVYLKTRKEHIERSLETTTTLMNVIKMIKSTAECVDDVFGKDGSILSALDFVTSSGWCPESIIIAMKDCNSSCLPQLKAEISKINSSYTQSYADGLSDGFVEEKCTKWIEGLSEVVEKRFKGMERYKALISKNLQLLWKMF